MQRVLLHALIFEARNGLRASLVKKGKRLMAVQQIMEKAFLSSLEALHEKGISPSADLTPVYVGKFCYIGKLALDEYYPIDERILGVAALVLTGLISWEKGWSAFKWVPEFILPIALDKSIGFLKIVIAIQPIVAG